MSGDDQRQGDRRRTQRRESSRALVPLEPQPAKTDSPASPAARPAGHDPVFAAQVMGQTGQKRGLKGGPPVLDAARAAYLGREYSGAKERRPAAGKTTKTDI